MAGDERKALIVASLLADVNSAIDGSGRTSPWFEERAAVLGDALGEYGYPTLSVDFQMWLGTYIDGNRHQSMPGWNALYQRIEKAADEIAHGHHEILDPNSVGQGYAPSHIATPFHDALLRSGYGYSHSTRIWHPYYGPGGVSDVRRGPEHSLRHSYKRGPRSVGVQVNRNGAWFWESKPLSGSARSTIGTSAVELERFLKGIARREKRRG